MKKNITILTTLMLGTLSAQAANVALSATYNYDVLPAFSGDTTNYRDDDGGVRHDGHTTAGAFDNGDLNNGTALTGAGTNPTGTGSDIVSWDPAPKAATITFDLGSTFDITSVRIDSFMRTDFNLGAPDDYQLSFSLDNSTYGAATSVTTGFAYASGGVNHTENVTETARYVRLAFDGTSNGGDKWSLSEIAIEGTAPVPEPSSTALLGLGGLALLMRRCK